MLWHAAENQAHYLLARPEDVLYVGVLRERERTVSPLGTGGFGHLLSWLLESICSGNFT